MSGRVPGLRAGRSGRGIPSAGVAGAVLALVLVGAGCGGDSPPRDAAAAAAIGDWERAWELSTAEVSGDAVSPLSWETRARVALATLRTNVGVEAIGHALEIEPTADRYLIRAYLDQARFRNVAAVAAADTARDLAPRNGRAERAAGELRLGGGMVGTADYEGAEAHFRAALQLDPDDVRSRFGLGKTLVLAGRHEEGVEWLDGALELRPLWGDAYYLRGVARMRSRDFEGAASDFRCAGELEPDHSAAWFNLGRVLERLGRESEAERARQHASVVRGVFERLRSAAVAWHSSGDPGSGLSLVARLREAGRWEESWLLARTLTQDHAQVPAVWLERAETALLFPDAAAALAAAERAIERAPGNPRATLALARAAAAAGDPGAALESARAARQISPDDVEPALLLAGLWLDQGNAGEAMTALEAIAPRAARDARLVALRARAVLALGQPAEAEALIGRALAAQSRAEWLEIRAAARHAGGRSGAARDDLRVALELEPRRVETWAALAEVQEAIGAGKKAQECREEIARIERQDAEIRALRATWRQSPGNVAAAAALADALTATGASMHAAQVWELTDGFGRKP